MEKKCQNPSRKIQNDTEDGGSATDLRIRKRKVQVIVCLLLVELCERFTFFGILCNMVLFCTVKLGYKYHQAAMVNLAFAGTTILTPVLVGWFAETCMGRTKVVYICSALHFLGTAMLPVVAFPFEDFYIDTNQIIHTLGKTEQSLLFYLGLLAASLGAGGIRAILCPLSAYDLQDYESSELMSFFNWFYWLANLNTAVVCVGIAYIQQSVAKNLGFLIPFTSVFLAMVTIHMVCSNLIYKPKKSGSLSTTFGVLLNATKMCCIRYRHLSGHVTCWLDRAKEHNGGKHRETHVEAIKSLVQLFPFFAFQILYRTCITQVPSAYVIQTMNSNLHLHGFLLPIALVNVIGITALLILAPVLECVLTCLSFTKKDRVAPTTFIIGGYICAALSVMVAGFTEMYRKKFPLVEQTLSGKVLLVSSMSCFQLTPQYILLGLAEALVTPACSVITLRLAPSSIRGLAMHFLILFYGVGCFFGVILIEAVYLLSGGMSFPSSLKDGKLEQFFFILASLMVLNTLGFWKVSYRYSNLNQDNDFGLKDSILTEKLLEHEKSLKFYESIL
ncbi:solute carrier family 15 member 5 [Protopterus annectens]|uniref:solute carrier family 15 member 5 n=1 Tax=Protopterus annectens TaxID=7888 RepID=UPI001CFC1976|nr:solute carrier family 15 member 5 [Protopterus annectens]